MTIDVQALVINYIIKHLRYHLLFRRNRQRKRNISDAIKVGVRPQRSCAPSRIILEHLFSSSCHYEVASEQKDGSLQRNSRAAWVKQRAHEWMGHSVRVLFIGRVNRCSIHRNMSHVLVFLRSRTIFKTDLRPVDSAGERVLSVWGPFLCWVSSDKTFMSVKHVKITQIFCIIHNLYSLQTRFHL